MSLNKEQHIRFNRQIILNDFGEKSQIKLLNSSVLVIGLGGLGSPVSQYLTASGVGTIGLADYDQVSMSNLPRQLLYDENDIGKNKVSSAHEKLERLSPTTKFNLYPYKLIDSNINDVVKKYDFIIDATDNFESKFLINDSCVTMNKSFSHGGVLGWTGQAITVVPNKSCCYRCVFREIPQPEVAKQQSLSGVIGPVAGLIGNIQAAEAIKYLIGNHDILTNSMLQIDCSTLKFRTVDLTSIQPCHLCSS